MTLASQSQDRKDALCNIIVTSRMLNSGLQDEPILVVLIFQNESSCASKKCFILNEKILTGGPFGPGNPVGP